MRIITWKGVAGTRLWSIHSLRGGLFVGCLLMMAVSGLALFHGLHEVGVASIQDDPPELTELPPEQLQPQLKTTLPNLTASMVTHPLLMPGTTPAMPPVPVMPSVVTADAQNLAPDVAPAVDQQAPSLSPKLRVTASDGEPQTPSETAPKEVSSSTGQIPVPTSSSISPGARLDGQIIEIDQEEIPIQIRSEPRDGTPATP